MDSIHQKFSNWRNSVSASVDISQESGDTYRTLLSSSALNNNRISKDRLGNELSRISRNAAADYSSLDSQDRNDIESCRLTVEEGNTSIVRTEASHTNHNEQEEYKEIRHEMNK